MTPIPALLTQIVATLRAAIGTHVARITRPLHTAWIGDRFYAEIRPPEPNPNVTLEAWALLWNRLGRLAQRFATLHARWQSNTLPRTRARAARPRRDPTAPAGTPGLRLPRAQGWVNHRIPDSAPPTGQLDAFLRDREAELRRFVTDAPQAGRLLRPLCLALGVPQPAWLKLPPRPRRPRPKPAPQQRWPSGQPRPATHPAPMLPDDRPLRGYVHRTARAWKKTGGSG